MFIPYIRTPKRFDKGWQITHVHTVTCRILYPDKDSCGEHFPVSTQYLHIKRESKRITVPIGFCCGGFSSTAGYVPGNEARNAEALASDIAIFRLVVPKDVIRFYPNNSKKFFNLI